MKINLDQLIDPKLKSLVENKDSQITNKKITHTKKQPDLTTPAGLTTARQSRQPAKPPLDRKVNKAIVEINGRKVPVRIIQPKRAKAQGVYLNIPGGGFYLNEAARNDQQNATLADALNVTVISVEYRLAPENPWPAAPDDCLTAALWLIKQSQALFGTSNLIIGGTSAGATLAMTTLLRLRDKHIETSFLGSVLQFGAYDLSGQTPGGRLYHNEYFIQAYVGKVKDQTQPDISPLFGNLKNLPPTLMLVGTSDILMEDNFALAARLSAAGNNVDLRVYPKAKHGFTSHRTEQSQAGNKDIINWLKQKLK